MDGFAGEPPGKRMKKLARSNPAVTCASCRQFDGLTWCGRWNFATAADSPICGHYRPRAVRGGDGSGDVARADQDGAHDQE